MGMPADLHPWTSQDPMLQNVAVGPRVLDLLDQAYFAWCLHCQKLRMSVSSNRWFVDLSQGVQRGPWSSAAPSFNQSSAPYSFFFDRVLDCEERPAMSACNEGERRHRLFSTLSAVPVRACLGPSIQVSWEREGENAV